MKVDVPDELLPADRLGHVHFVGIGGAGLSAIARIMLARGIRVSGSEASSHRARRVRELGARVHVGHASDQLGDADTVVGVDRRTRGQPEYVAALARGCGAAAFRGTRLGDGGRRVLAVAGTRGKTTTTALLTVAHGGGRGRPDVRHRADLDRHRQQRRRGRRRAVRGGGRRERGAFLHYAPHAAIVTNVEADHLDHWRTEEAYAQAFDDFAATWTRGVPGGLRRRPGAAALADRRRRAGAACRDGVGAGRRGGRRAGRAGGHRAVVTGGPLRRGRARWPSRPAGPWLRRRRPAAAGSARSPEPVADGAQGEAGGVRVYDSYAHHPTEITGASPPPGH